MRVYTVFSTTNLVLLSNLVPTLLQVWDHEQNTLNGEGVEAVRRCETESHGLTGL